MKETTVQCTNIWKHTDQELKCSFTQRWVDVINAKEEKKDQKAAFTNQYV